MIPLALPTTWGRPLCRLMLLSSDPPPSSAKNSRKHKRVRFKVSSQVLPVRQNPHSMWGLRKIYDIWSSQAYFFKNCETQSLNGYYMQQVAVKNSLSKSSMGLRDNSIGCGTGFCEILTISNWALAQGQNSFLPCKLKKELDLINCNKASKRHST